MKQSKTANDTSNKVKKSPIIRGIAVFGIIMLICSVVALVVVNIFKVPDNVLQPSGNILSRTVETCNAAYPDRGEPVQEIYHYKNYEEYEAAKKARATFGSLKLVDDGNALIFDMTSEDYSDKETCLYKRVGLPESIKSAINHTTAADGTRQDEWGDYKIEWSYRNKETHIIIKMK